MSAPAPLANGAARAGAETALRTLAVVGLGKLGACTAAAFAAGGYDVVGVDVDRAPVERLNAGEAPVAEPGLAELVAEGRARLRATTNIAEAVAVADATFVVVPTPSQPDGRFSLAHVLTATAAIGRALRARPRARYHVVAITSTVLPGSLEHAVRPLLERESGRLCGRDLGLCYNPEFIALGSVLADFRRPDLVLIGESDGRAGAALAAVYGRVCENAPAIARMSFASAELAKLALNTFVTTKISFANMLAELCEALPGASVDEVCRALGLDRRIGPRALQAGLGYGGPCFPRDNAALAALARELGTCAAIAPATDAVNAALVTRLTRLVRAQLAPGGRVAVLGLAYKAGTAIVEAAHGLKLVARLAGHGVRVVAYDALARAAAQATLPGGVAFAETPADCLAQADVAVLAAHDGALARVVKSALAARTVPLVLVDCWRQLAEHDLPPSVTRIALGVGAESAENAARLAGLWNPS